MNLEEYIDQRRWLMNNNLVTEDVQNELFLFGSIVHKDVQAVELQVDAEKKVVAYTIYIDKFLLKKIAKYESLLKSDSLWNLWRLKRMLKREGSLDFKQILNSFVRDFCGTKWCATVKIIDFSQYIDSLGENSELNGAGGQPDKLSY